MFILLQHLMRTISHSGPKLRDSVKNSYNYNISPLYVGRTQKVIVLTFRFRFVTVETVLYAALSTSSSRIRPIYRYV